MLAINPIYKYQIGGFKPLEILAISVIYGFAALPFNLAPQLMATIIQDFKTSEATVGLLISAELLTIALTVIFLSSKISSLPIRKIATIATLALASLNVFSILANDLNVLMAIRMAAGLAAGVIVTCAYYLVGISSDPVRLFGLITIANVFLGAIFISLLPTAIEAWQFRGAYAIMATPILLAALLLAQIKRPANTESSPEELHTKNNLGLLGLLFIFSVFIVQFTQGGYFTFVELIGLRLSIPSGIIAMGIAGSYIVSLGGSSIASIMGDRLGILKPLFIGMLGHAIGVCLVVFASSQTEFIIGLSIQAFFFFMFIPYMLGLAAILDHSGYLSTLTAGTVLFGLGLGPVILGSIIEEKNYSSIAYSVSTSITIGFLIIYFVTRRLQNLTPRESS